MWIIARVMGGNRNVQVEDFTGEQRRVDVRGNPGTMKEILSQGADPSYEAFIASNPVELRLLEEYDDDDDD